MELDIASFNPYSILKNISFKINKEINHTDVCSKSVGRDEFEKSFDGMFSMIDFENILSSLKDQSLVEYVIGYSKDEHIVKVKEMGKMFSVIKFNNIFTQLQENNPVFINSIDLNTNWTLTQNHDWKNKCITSELTISFLSIIRIPKCFLIGSVGLVLWTIYRQTILNYISLSLTISKIISLI